jgi:predicted outer membrane repeat protein
MRVACALVFGVASAVTLRQADSGRIARSRTKRGQKRVSAIHAGLIAERSIVNEVSDTPLSAAKPLLERTSQCTATVGQGSADCSGIQPCLQALPAECRVKTLILQPGIHSGRQNTKVEILGGETVELIGAAGNARGAVVDGGGTAWLFSVVDSGSLSLRNLTLQHAFLNSSVTTMCGAALSVIGQGAVRAEAVRFFNNEAAGVQGRGGAVAVADSGDMPGRWLQADFMNCQWDSNRAGHVAGGMYISSASPTFTCCTWAHNVAGVGGGGVDFYVDSSAQRSEFKNCSFLYNSAGFVGGGIYIDDASPDFSDCSWLGNSALGSNGGFGGGLGWFGASTVPGASTTPVSLWNCSFRSCTSNEGGGMHIQDAAVNFVACSWVDNTAEGAGGGLSLCSTSTASTLPLALLNCAFERNTAVYSGGAVYAEAVIGLSFSHVRFLQNQIFDQAFTWLDYGGAVDFSAPAFEGELLLQFSYCLFEGNRASGRGGSLSIVITPSRDSQPLQSAVSLLSTVFRNNTAFFGGGAVDVSFPPDAPANLRFSDGCQGVSCTDPGAAQANVAPQVYASNTARTWTRSMLLHLTNVQFIRNAGNDGGAVAMSNGQVRMRNVSFVQNTADRYGGALFLDGTAALRAANTSWLNNAVAVDIFKQESSASGQHIYATAGAGEWEFVGNTTFAHASTRAAGLSAAQTDGVSGLDAASVHVTCPPGAVVTDSKLWVSEFTAASDDWALGAGQTRISKTHTFFNASLYPGAWVPLPSEVSLRNNTSCEQEYFANYMCGNPTAVVPSMLYTVVRLGCTQCARSEAALPTGKLINGSGTGLTMECEACPRNWADTGATCDSGHVVQTPGWWRSRQDNFVNKATNFHECYTHHSACLGSANSSSGTRPYGEQCIAGHTGPVCALCQVGYAMRLRRCVKCTGERSADIVVLIVVIATVAGAVFLFLRWSQQTRISKLTAASVKIVVGFYSLLALVAQTFAIGWPSGFHRALEIIQTAFASIADLSAFACAFPINWYTKLYSWCSVLFFSLSAIGVHYKLTEARGGGTTTQTHARYALNAALIVYPFLTQTAVAVFNCRTIDGVSYLQADYTIRCDSHSRYFAVACSALVSLVFVFGLPLVCARAVWIDDASIGFLSDGYRKDSGKIVLGWEVTEMVRKFLLTSAVIFFNEGSSTQVSRHVLVYASCA